MNTDKLVHMANQIAQYFDAYPEPEAVAGVRDHIIAFWTPRMVEALRDRVAADPAGLRLSAAEAMRHPVAAESPAERVTEGPDQLGAMASDAG